MAITLAGVTPASADAGPGATVLEGTATLNNGFPYGGIGSGGFTGCGEAVSASAGTSTCVPVLGSNASASYAYTEPCVAAAVPVVAAGFATGTISIGTASENFEWIRVGLTAVVLLDQSAYGTPGQLQAHANGGAVAVFAPTGVPGTNCNGGAPLNAQVVSIGAWEPVSA